MNAHRIETTLTEDRRIILEDLPFRAGDRVEVIVLERDAINGSVPVEGPETDWDVLNPILERAKVETGVPDLAHQHDHYLHGRPKRI